MIAESAGNNQPLIQDRTEQANPQAPTHTAFITDADCTDFINENPARVRCGFIDLPVNHSEPAKGKVTLPILIAGQTRSMSAAPSDKAILIPGGGGPGASIGFGVPYLRGEYLGYYDNVRSAGFDIVILDQRGAGFAKPALRCAETVIAFKESVESDTTLTKALTAYRESLSVCRARLQAQKISLTDFDTEQSALDFLAIIRLLPYDWWGTVATSYATVIAQAMEIIEPAVFDRLVLDSPVPIDYQQPYTFESTEFSIQRILSLCEITRRCNRKHSDIKNKFKAVLEQAKQNPYSVTIDIPESPDHQQVQLRINDSTLLDMLMLSAYNNYTLTEIPWLIDELYKKRPRRLRLLAADYWHYNSDLEFAAALSWTIHCKERQPLEAAFLRLHPEATNRYSADSKLALDQEQLICQQWGIPAAGYKTPVKPITSKTLIVAGDLDPVISRKDIKNAADNFANKEVMILPGMGHSIWFQSECTRQNVLTFFTQNPTTTLTQCKDGITRFK